MELLVVLIVLGGLWAALLLPSFLDSRHDAPLTSTKSFDRRLAKLASLRSESIDPVALRRQSVLARRRRVMIGLIGAALVTLVAAIFRGSIPLLLLSLAFDGMFVAVSGSSQFCAVPARHHPPTEYAETGGRIRRAPTGRR